MCPGNRETPLGPGIGRLTAPSLPMSAGMIRSRRLGASAQLYLPHLGLGQAMVRFPQRRPRTSSSRSSTSILPLFHEGLLPGRHAYDRTQDFRSDGDLGARIRKTTRPSAVIRPCEPDGQAMEASDSMRLSDPAVIVRKESQAIPAARIKAAAGQDHPAQDHRKMTWVQVLPWESACPSRIDTCTVGDRVDERVVSDDQHGPSLRIATGRGTCASTYRTALGIKISRRLVGKDDRRRDRRRPCAMASRRR